MRIRLSVIALTLNCGQGLPLVLSGYSQGRQIMINQIVDALFAMRIWRDSHGQDMVEYALMAGFITIAVAAVFPPVGSEISVIWSKLDSTMDATP